MCSTNRFARWVPAATVIACCLLGLGCNRRLPAPGATVTPAVTPTIPVPIATPTPYGSNATPVPDLGVTLRIGWTDAPDSLWPFPDSPGGTDVILSLLYDTLIYRAPDNTYRPALVQEWSSADGGKTWSLELEPNVRTHDGRPFTAEDVALNLRRYEGSARFRYYSGHPPAIKAVEVQGPTRLTIELNEPTDSVEALLHWMPMLPKHVWESIDVSEPSAVDESRFSGTGPFALHEFLPRQQITLIANRDYWGSAPRVEAIVFSTYADAETLTDALRNGRADLITRVPLHRISELRNDPDIQVVSGLQTHVRQLALNLSDEAHSTGHPALKDPQVRLAMARAIDRQQMIDHALAGQGLPGLSVVPPGLHDWFNAALEDAAFDLAEANRILDQAGYHDTDDDGVRETPDGNTPLSFRLFVSAESAPGSREMEMLSNWLRQIGIQTAAQTLLPAALDSAGCPGCDYDLMLTDLQGGPDPGFYLSTLTSAEIATGLNVTGYHSPAYDGLYEQQAAAIERDQRQSMVLEMQEIILGDRPVVILYYGLAVQAFRRDRFQDWLFVPNGLLALTDQRSLTRVVPVR